MKDRRFINASEVGQFVFCRRSWFLQSRKTPSLLEAERAKGIGFHQHHSDRMHVARRALAVSRRAAVVTLILLALWLWWAVALHSDPETECKADDAEIGPGRPTGTENRHPSMAR